MLSKNTFRLNDIGFIFLFVIFIIFINACADDEPAAISSDDSAFLTDYESPKEKWGLLNLQNEIVYENNLDELRSFKNGYAAVNVAGKWGFLDTTLQMVVEPVYRAAWNYNSSFARVQVADGSYNYLDQNFNLGFEEDFQFAYDYVDGIASAKVGLDSFIILNDKKRLQKIIKADDLRPVDGGYLIAENKNMQRLLNVDGEPVFSSSYERITVINDSIFRIKTDGMYGVINKKEQFLIPAEYRKLNIPIDNWIVAMNDRNFNIFKDYEKRYTTDEYQALRYAGNSTFAYLKEGKWGLLDTTLNNITEPKYNQLYNFSGGYAPYKNGELWGFINPDGIEITDAVYGLILPYENGYSRVMYREGMGLIDENQKIIIPPVGRAYRSVTAAFVPFKE